MTVKGSDIRLSVGAPQGLKMESWTALSNNIDAHAGRGTHSFHRDAEAGPVIVAFLRSLEVTAFNEAAELG